MEFTRECGAFIFLDAREGKGKEKECGIDTTMMRLPMDTSSRDDSPTTREQSSSVASRIRQEEIRMWNKINDPFLRSKGPDRAPHSQEEQISQAAQHR
jgi:hypothetical protein